MPRLCPVARPDRAGPLGHVAGGQPRSRDALHADRLAAVAVARLSVSGGRLTARESNRSDALPSYNRDPGRDRVRRRRRVPVGRVRAVRGLLGPGPTRPFAVPRPRPAGRGGRGSLAGGACSTISVASVRTSRRDAAARRERASRPSACSSRRTRAPCSTSDASPTRSAPATGATRSASRVCWRAVWSRPACAS